MKIFKKAILTNYSQNISAADLLSVFRPVSNSSEKLTSLLNEYFQSHSYLVDSGRTALFLSLEALKPHKPQATEVLLAGFTCIVVINAILKANLTPVFVDIETDNFQISITDLQQKITPSTLAVITQNTFGHPDDHSQLQQLKFQHDFFIIEDLAHSIGQTYNQKPLGTFFDLAILSFGANKILTCSQGGAIIVNDPKFLPILNQKLASLPKFPPIKALKHYFKLLSFYLFAKIFHQSGKLVLALLAKLKFFPKILEHNEKKNHFLPNPTQFSPLLAQIAYSQFQALTKNIQHRQALASIYQSAFPDQNPKRHNYLMIFPLILDQNSYFKLLKSAASQGIYLSTDWSKQAVVPPDSISQIKNPCQNAHNLSKYIVGLPLHQNISQKQAKTLALNLLNLTNV